MYEVDVAIFMNKCQCKNSHVISILTLKDYLIYIHIIREAHQGKNYFYLESVM